MTTPTKRNAVARLVDGSNGKLLFGDDPRLAHQNKPGSTGTTAEPVDRHRLLFSAAANLAEFGCSTELAFALLGEAGLDSGLSPSDVRRQIECGLQHH